MLSSCRSRFQSVVFFLFLCCLKELAAPGWRKTKFLYDLVLVLVMVLSVALFFHLSANFTKQLLVIELKIDSGKLNQTDRPLCGVG